MRLTRAVGVLLAALFILGCAGPKVKVEQPMAYTDIKIELGKYSYTLANGTKDSKSVPWGMTYRIKGGEFTPSDPLFSIRALIGVDAYQTPAGMEGSPWAGLQFSRIRIGSTEIGTDFGFDKKNFTIGMDWTVHGLVVGPNICYPYLSTKSSGIGGKAAFLF